ncbi:sensor histidine kinase [Hyphomonas pacifica]|uniref:histidine kinase n=2 Tax=Hyphomonas pacifica TaxID=1280941 RepID=A0A062U0X7_9PROT|nr:ATP-binding protein [Hyphomonas pacifica]KCZ48409.1 hypothetical protein HY2_04170 [Hyphomonas pacifica]RAN31721.1 hypothetical protein HY3_03865 [Hyphomonas pacifica]RAN32114.1 hypothetical protein HY11_05930 [Hyphomonas pacifica]
MSEGMSADAKEAAKRALTRRARDFVTLVACFGAILFLMWLTGAVGLIEAFAALLVAASVAMAVYVGTASILPISPRFAIEPTTTVPELHDSTVMLDALPLPAFEIDDEQRIVAFNEEAEFILRLDGRVKPRASTVIRSPGLLSAIENAIDSGTVEPTAVEVESGPDETWRAYVSRPGRARRTLVVLEDLTPVRRAARARSDFLANASHELRTPLTALSGFIETMRGPAKDDKDSWDRFLAIMAGETQRMSRLIADLLSLSRIESSEHVSPREREEFQDIVSDATHAFSAIASEKGVRLEVRAESGSIPVIAHRDEMIQVVENLVSNALKYSVEGGQIVLSFGLSSSMADARIKAGQSWMGAERMTLLPASGRPGTKERAVWMRVEDQGPGIEREHLPRLGERFYRADQSRGGKITGTGLGLAIVKHIMAHHRGGFAVETRIGEGTAFGVWLPAAREEGLKD